MIFLNSSNTLNSMKKNYFTLLICSISVMGLSQPAFMNISEVAGVADEGHNIGISFSDFDRDGDQDFYVATRSGANKLFENLGNNTFMNIAPMVGVNSRASSRSGIWVDINNDGFQDLYVSNFLEGDILYLNNGDKTFTNISRSAGIDNENRPFSVNVADVNQDGFLDIYISNFQTENILYKNNGDHTFTNIVEQSGATDRLNAMGSIFFDYDNDNDLDLYLTHDGQPYILYKNIGGGNFIDVSEEAGINYDGNGMGTDVGDINNDGWLDIYVTNLYENTLFLNNGDGTFTDISQASRSDDYGMGWGTNFLDYNNDGWLDIYVTNDSYFSPYPNVLYRNNGDNTFGIVEAAGSVSSMLGGYGSACSDIDMDGRVDLVIANAGRRDHVELFHNQAPQANWIGFQLEGVRSNRDAVGARIEVTDSDSIIRIEEVASGSGYASQNSLIQHFGLGKASSVSSLKVSWPSGRRQTFDNLDINQYYYVKEGEAPQPLGNTTTPVNNLELQEYNYNLYPNPTSDAFALELYLPKAVPLNVSIVDQMGRLAQPSQQLQAIAGHNNWTIHLQSDLPAGTYRFLLQGEGINFSGSLIIE